MQSCPFTLCSRWHFPQPQRTGNVPAVLFRHHLRNNLWPYPWSYQVQRQAYPLCNGASKLPSPLSQSVCLLMWDKAKDFLTRAFTVIFTASIIIWFLQSFDTRLNVVADSSQSMLAAIGKIISPVLHLSALTTGAYPRHLSQALPQRKLWYPPCLCWWELPPTTCFPHFCRECSLL